MSDGATPTTRIPMVDLQAGLAALKPEIDAALQSVVASQAFVLGQEVADFEAELGTSLEGPDVVGCASGSDALLLALTALGVGPGDQVICPAFSFFASASAIARLGAQPVFADIDPKYFCLAPESAAKAAQSCTRLRALLPVHLFGRIAPCDELRSIAEAHGAVLVHDAAQAIGARDESGAPLGTRDFATCFSFYPSKNLGAFGDAGAVVTPKREVAEEVRRLRVHGSAGSDDERYIHTRLGINSRLDALQAAVLRVKLPHLADWNRRRRNLAEHYAACFASQDLPEERLRLPEIPESASQHVFHQYVVRVSGRVRAGLREHLASKGISSAVYYPVPLHLQECFTRPGVAPPSLPESESACREVLALPIYPELQTEEVEDIVECVASFLRVAQLSEETTSPRE